MTLRRALVDNLEPIALGVLIAGAMLFLFVLPDVATTGISVLVGLYAVAFLADEFVDEATLYELAGVEEGEA